jgi:hypothetical protein
VAWLLTDGPPSRLAPSTRSSPRWGCNDPSAGRAIRPSLYDDRTRKERPSLVVEFGAPVGVPHSGRPTDTRRSTSQGRDNRRSACPEHLGSAAFGVHDMCGDPRRGVLLDKRAANEFPPAPVNLTEAGSRCPTGRGLSDRLRRKPAGPTRCRHVIGLTSSRVAPFRVRQPCNPVLRRQHHACIPAVL